jgi:hypothetical protein
MVPLRLMMRRAAPTGCALIALLLLAAPRVDAQGVEAGLFGEFMLGATRYAPEGYGSELWFTLGVAAGVKTYVARHLGFRFEARGDYTPVSISGRMYGGPDGCLVGYAGAGTFQGDASGGVLVAF